MEEATVGSFTLVTVDRPSRTHTARVLMSEYAAMPHTRGRWTTAAADIAALPQPYVPPNGVLLIALAADDRDPGADSAALACGALIGLADPGVAEIKRVYVRPTARRRGLGEVMTRALMDWAGRLGYDRVRLDTAPELHAAIRLYRRLGFTDIGPYKDGLLTDAVCMERSLEAHRR